MYPLARKNKRGPVLDAKAMFPSRICILLAAWLAIVSAQPVSAQPVSAQPVVPQSVEYIVTLQDGLVWNIGTDDLAVMCAANSSIYGSAAGSISRAEMLAPGIALVLGTDATMDLLFQDPRVLTVESNEQYTVQPIYPAHVEEEARTWGIDRIDGALDGAVERGEYDGKGVTVYIVDTGIYGGHNEFLASGKSRVQAGMDFTVAPPGKANFDCHGHGTHTASIAAGKTFGFATRASIVPVKVLSCGGAGSLANVIRGIEWSASRPGPKVISMSLGGSYSSAMNKAVAAATEKGALVVVAAGNSAVDACDSSPASERTAITVAATTSRDDRASYSNFGPCVDIFAPGSDITAAGTTAPDATRTMSGTSMACPYVSGVAATVMQELAAKGVKNITPAQVQATITEWAEKGVVIDARAANIFLNNKAAAVPTAMPTRKGATKPPTLMPTTAMPSQSPTATPTSLPTRMTPCTRYGSEERCTNDSKCVWLPFWRCQKRDFCGFRCMATCLARDCAWTNGRCAKPRA